VRAVAARYPDDPGVLAALAEAEYDAGNDQAAITAADRAIASDPSRVNAYVQKGYALFRRAGEAPADKRENAYKAAMRPFEALNKIENDHPLPLIYHYRSFVEQGREPPESARHALEWASQLAPFDDGLAYQAALMQAREGSIALARRGLLALAANPHGGPLAQRSRRLADSMSALAEGTRWQGAPMLELDTELAQVDAPREGDE
jgi:tetratricopeptide (TPR) repeat protein